MSSVVENQLFAAALLVSVKSMSMISLGSYQHIRSTRAKLLVVVVQCMYLPFVPAGKSPT